MAKRSPSIVRLPGDGIGDGRVTFRLYPETADLFGDCLLFFVRHHPNHPKAATLKDWAKVMQPRTRKRSK